MEKHVKHFFIPVCIILLLVCGSACGDKKEVASPTEAKLDVKLSAGVIENSPSNSYSFNVNILSALPVSGVTIKVDVKREDNSASIYNVLANSSVSSSSFTINPLPPGQVYCLATITVTSVNTPTNTWSGTFRVLWK